MTDSFQKVILTGSTNGIGVPINAITAGTANTIHTADASSLDETWLSFTNNSASDVLLTLAIGGVGSTNLVHETIPAGRGFTPVLSGFTFTGGVIIKAYASVTGAIVAYGFVNRIVTI
jgi:hypothetical protein